MAAYHAVELLRRIHIPVDLGPHRLHRRDPHQLDLKEVRTLIEHEVVLQPRDDLPEEIPLGLAQALVDPDPVGHRMRVVRVGTAALGPRGNPPCTVPAVGVLLVFLFRRHDRLPTMCSMASLKLPTAGFGGEDRFRAA